MKKLSLLFGILLVAFLTNAQNHVFSVLANKGVNTVQKGTAWTTIVTGAKVYKGNKIKIVAGGYAGLMHKSGKTIELKTPGTYDIATLESRLSSSSSSYAEKYAKFALNMDNEDYSKYNYNVTGSVERAIAGNFSLLSTEEIKFIQEIPFSVTWMSDADEAQTVELRMTTLFSETVYSTETSGNTASVDLKGLELNQDPNTYIINLFDPETDEQVIGKGIKCTPLNADTAKTVLTEYNNLKKELDENSPLDNMVLAGFFQEKNLDIYAASHLYKASQLAPEIESYKAAYYTFLESKGIVEKSVKE